MQWAKAGRLEVEMEVLGSKAWTSEIKGQGVLDNISKLKLRYI